MATPPPMERTPADDVKVILGVLAGVALGVWLFSGEWSIVLGAAVGLVVVTALLNLARRVRSRRRD